MRVEIDGGTLELVLGDITEQRVDAIVNAANPGLRGGAGVDGAIHRRGGPGIMAEGRKLGGCPTGSACITTAGRLPATFVIHAVGPVWRGGASDEAQLLRGAYGRSLEIAAEKNLSSIAFPSISTGAYRYPLKEAARIALATVIEHLRQETPLERVVFVLFNSEVFDAYAEALDELAGGPGPGR